jgi:hypothetical protein
MFHEVAFADLDDRALGRDEDALASSAALLPLGRPRRLDSRRLGLDARRGRRPGDAVISPCRKS